MKKRRKSGKPCGLAAVANANQIYFIIHSPRGTTFVHNTGRKWAHLGTVQSRRLKPRREVRIKPKGRQKPQDAFFRLLAGVEEKIVCS